MVIELYFTFKPGPVPGMRPSMGGPGIQPQAAQRSQGGSMGILMPLYTIGIIVFFVYTVFKVRHILMKMGICIMCLIPILAPSVCYSNVCCVFQLAFGCLLVKTLFSAFPDIFLNFLCKQI